MARMRVSYLLLGFVLLAGTPAVADQRINDSTTLEIRTKDKQSVHDTRTGVEYPLAPKSNRFVVRSDVMVVIVVADQNPLLFDYRSETKTEEAASYTAATAFAASLGKLLALFPEAKLADAQQPTVDGFSPTALRDAVVQLADHIQRIPAYLALSVGSDAEIAQLKQDLLSPATRGLPELVERQYQMMLPIARKCLENGDQKIIINGQIPTTCDAPYELALAVAVEQTRSALARARLREAELTTAKDRAVERQKAAAGTVELWLAQQTQGKKMTPNGEAALRLAREDERVAAEAAATAARKLDEAQKITAAAQQTFDEAMQPMTAAQASGVTLRQFIQLMLAMDTRVDKQAQLLRELIADVDSLNKPREIATHNYSYKDVTTTTVKIEARAKYQAFMSDSVRSYQKGGVRTFDIVTDAYRPVHLSPGVGFVLGFVPNPTFTAVKDGETFKIVKTEEDLTRYEVAAMLHLTPDSWREPTFGGFFQLGVSPKKNEFGFFFGAGVQAQTVFTFGAGLMLQQIRRLAPGLDMSSRLAAASDLKTDTEFKPGLYLHATVTLPQKK